MDSKLRNEKKDDVTVLVREGSMAFKSQKHRAKQQEKLQPEQGAKVTAPPLGIF